MNRQSVTATVRNLVLFTAIMSTLESGVFAAVTLKPGEYKFSCKLPAQVKKTNPKNGIFYHSSDFWSVALLVSTQQKISTVTTILGSFGSGNPMTYNTISHTMTSVPNNDIGKVVNGGGSVAISVEQSWNPPYPATTNKGGAYGNTYFVIGYDTGSAKLSGNLTRAKIVDNSAVAGFSYHEFNSRIKCALVSTP